MSRTADGLPPESLLALFRLATAGPEGIARAPLARDLKPLVGHRWEGSAWSARLDAAIEGLAGSGHLTRTRPTKGPERLALTDAGRAVAMESLGVDGLPEGTTWAKLKSAYLPGFALGRTRPGPDAAGVKRLATAGGLKAELLRAQFGLDLGPKATAKEATDAAAGRLFGLEPGARWSADAILRKLLADAGIAIPPGKPTSPGAIAEALFRRELADPQARKPLDRLVARGVGARQPGAAELRAAAVRSWVDRHSGDEAEPEGAAIAGDDEAFAARVIAAARSSREGRFGEDKVFIHHLWRAIGDDPAAGGMPLEDFKARLVAAHRARRLELARADLVEAMDPEDVRASATPHLNAVYHFVRSEEPNR